MTTGSTAHRTYGQPWCPLARFLDLLGDRWTLLVAREMLFAHPRPLRFGELAEELPGISRNLLNSRLRELEAAGIVEPNTGGAARAIGGWGLTERGASLGEVLRAIGTWGIENLADPTAADRRTVRRRLSSLG